MTGEKLKKNISGPQIRRVRLERGLDQVELAAILNVDYDIKLEQSDISEIERQNRHIKDIELLAIALALDVDPIFLLRGNA